MNSTQDILDWIEAHQEHWSVGQKYPGIEYWTLARIKARDVREFLNVTEYTREHGRPGRLDDGTVRKNALRYLQITVAGQEQLLWAMPFPHYMQRCIFRAVDGGQIRWAVPVVRTRTARQLINTKPFEPFEPLSF